MDDAFEPEFVEFVDGAEDQQAAGRIVDAGGVEDAVEQFAVVDANDEIGSGNAKFPQGTAQDRADFGVRRRRRGADGVEIALVELAEAARARFLLAAEHRAELVAAERRGQIGVGGDDPGKRRREVVAQGDPFPIVVP